MSLVPGSQFGHYEIVESIGVGGMGDVYRARDPELIEGPTLAYRTPATNGVTALCLEPHDLWI